MIAAETTFGAEQPRESRFSFSFTFTSSPAFINNVPFCLGQTVNFDPNSLFMPDHEARGYHEGNIWTAL